MTLSLIQYRGADGLRGVAALRDGGAPHIVPGAETTLALARRAIAEGATLAALVDAAGEGEALDLGTVELLAPIDHADPAHLLMTGTGLTISARPRAATKCTARSATPRSKPIR